MMIPQGADTDSVMLDETKDYTEGLMLAWSKLLGDVGAGTHRSGYIRLPLFSTAQPRYTSFPITFGSCSSDVRIGYHPTRRFDLRISPRGVIDPKPGPDPDGGYKAGQALIRGYGKTTKDNADGDPATVLRENLDPAFNAFCQAHNL